MYRIRFQPREGIHIFSNLLLLGTVDVAGEGDESPGRVQRRLIEPLGAGNKSPYGMIIAARLGAAVQRQSHHFEAGLFILRRGTDDRTTPSYPFAVMVAGLGLLRSSGRERLPGLQFTGDRGAGA